MSIATLVDAVRVCAENGGAELNLVIYDEEQHGREVIRKYKLATGEDCEPIDCDSWRVSSTGRVLRRVGTESHSPTNPPPRKPAF